MLFAFVIEGARKKTVAGSLAMSVAYKRTTMNMCGFVTPLRAPSVTMSKYYCDPSISEQRQLLISPVGNQDKCSNR